MELHIRVYLPGEKPPKQKKPYNYVELMNSWNRQRVNLSVCAGGEGQSIAARLGLVEAGAELAQRIFALLFAIKAIPENADEKDQCQQKQRKRDIPIYFGKLEHDKID